MTEKHNTRTRTELEAAVQRARAAWREMIDDRKLDDADLARGLILNSDRWQMANCLSIIANELLAR